MKIVKLKLGLFLSLLTIASTGAMAQNAKLNISLSHAAGDTYETVMTSDGMSHAWENSSVVFTVELDDSTVLNDTVVIHLMSTDGTILATYNTQIGKSLASNPLARGEYKVYAELSVLYKDSTYSKSSMDASFRLWTKPRATFPDISTVDSVIWNTTPATLKADVTEGDWRYAWSVNGKLVTNTPEGPQSWSLGAGSTHEQQTLDLQVDCVAPDGTTVWYSEKATQTLTIWRYPSVTLNTSDTEMYYGYEKPLVATVTGGDESWTTQWLLGNTIMSETQTYIPNVKSTTDPQEMTYYFHAYDKPEGMRESLAFSTDLSCHVSFWLAPSARIEGGNSFVIFDGESATLALATIGHEKDEWSFEWKSGSSMLTSSGASYTFNGVNRQSDGPVTNDITVEAVLVKPALGDVSYDSTFYFTVTVWPEPKLTQNIEYNGRIYISTIDVCAKDEGQSVSLQAVTSGGDKSAWSYSWTHNTIRVTSFDNICQFSIPANTNRDASITHSYTVKATNSPKGIERSWVQNAYYTINVWPVPVLDCPSMNNLVVVDGDSLPISQMAHGGYTKGWRYECSVNGGQQQSLSHYTFTNSTGDIHEVTLKGRMANYSPDDQKWYESPEDVTVKAEVYPQPKIEVCGLEADTAYFYGDSFAIKASHDYKFGTWTYSLTCNGNVVATGNNGIDYNCVIPTSKNETETYRYVLTVKCVTEEGSTLFTKKYDATINTYMKYSAKMDLTNPVAAYDGETYSLTVSPLGGNTNYWSYQWLDEQYRPLKATGYLYTKTVNLKNSEPKQVVYHVVCTYKPFLAEGISETLTWTVTEYASIVEGHKNSNPEKMVRQDDEVSLSVISPQYGNPGGWHYQWYAGKDKLGDEYVSADEIQTKEIVFELPQTTEKGKETVDVSYSLKFWNVSPDGQKRWGKEQTLDYAFVIHKRPIQPALVRKGGDSNTSGIYIVKDFGMSDDELDKYEYIVEFGDNTGVLQTDTTTRFVRYAGSPSEIWARSLWVYSDGFRCYSDKSYLGKAQSDRAPGILHMKGYHFSVELDEPAAAIVSVYEYDGTMAREYTFPEQLSFDEELDLSGLRKGVCVIRFCIGDIVESYKTIIK